MYIITSENPKNADRIVFGPFPSRKIAERHVTAITALFNDCGIILRVPDAKFLPTCAAAIRSAAE